MPSAEVLLYNDLFQYFFFFFKLKATKLLPQFTLSSQFESRKVLAITDELVIFCLFVSVHIYTHAIVQPGQQ